MLCRSRCRLVVAAATGDVAAALSAAETAAQPTAADADADDFGNCLKSGSRLSKKACFPSWASSIK